MNLVNYNFKKSSVYAELFFIFAPYKKQLMENNQIQSNGNGELAILFIGLILAYLAFNMMETINDANEDVKVSETTHKSTIRDSVNTYTAIKKVMLNEANGSTYYYLKLVDKNNDKRTFEIERDNYVKFEPNDTITIVDTYNVDGTLRDSKIR